MAIKIITGSIGSGKTRYCIDEIHSCRKSNFDGRCIMLVPSHYSHETERLLINEFGGTGLNGIECTSFEKLARELCPANKKRLGASGKHALICRAVSLCATELESRRDEFDPRLISAIRKKGFTEIAASFLNELNRYGTDADMLLRNAEQTDNPLLSQKLKIMALISQRYKNLINDLDYIDSDEDLHRLATVIANHFTADDRIWIDKFDEFLPEQFEVVAALIDSRADITITFNACPNPDDTYYGTSNTIEWLTAYTDCEIIRLDGGMEHLSDLPDLKFLFSTWFTREVYDGTVENAEIFTARDPYTEIEHIARKILDLTREDGCRFRDIGIICADSESYQHIFEAVFDEYEIPYYSDRHIAISEYPIAMQVLSLFHIVQSNWDYSSMFEYLRSGFIYQKKKINGRRKYQRLSADDIDLLENFAIKYGIEYKSAWTRPWQKHEPGIIDTALGVADDVNDEENPLEALRRQITEPLVTYTNSIQSAVTVSDYCRALYGFLEDINLYQGLKSELLSLALNDATEDSQRFGQIWNLILDIIDQVNTALGDTPATHDEFAQYVTAAMSQCSIRTIPSGVDRVFIGSADMNRAINTKIVFVAGAVLGTFPTPASTEGFLSNADREYLVANELRLAPTTVRKTEKLHNTVYKLLSAVTGKLYISYPSMTSDGSSCLPSQTVTDIAFKLRNIRRYDDLLGDTADIVYISSPKATLHKRLTSAPENPLWSHVDDWFNDHEQWQRVLRTVNYAKESYSYKNITLDTELAQELYRNNSRYSATRLNTYANCPFSHFMQYGLKARPNEEYKINAADTGSYAHEIIRKFCDTVDQTPDIDWATIDDTQCGEIVSQIVSDAVAKVKDSDLRDKETVADILARMGNAVTEAAKTTLHGIKCGAFRTDSYEKEVGITIGNGIEVGGIIDRIDVCRHDGINEYRIIDYKTGKNEFSPSEIYHGLNMQLVIYGICMRSLDDKAKISGMYYSKVHNDFPQINVTSRESTAMSELKKNTAYSGVAFVNMTADSVPDTNDINRIESEPARAENGSMFFKVTKDGIQTDKRIKSYEQGEQLMERVQSNIIDADRNIKNGVIDVSPLVCGNRSACAFCPYGSACSFDDAHKSERTITETDNEIWDKLEEDN